MKTRRCLSRSVVHGWLKPKSFSVTYVWRSLVRSWLFKKIFDMVESKVKFVYENNVWFNKLHQMTFKKLERLKILFDCDSNMNYFELYNHTFSWRSIIKFTIIVKADWTSTFSENEYRRYYGLWMEQNTLWTGCSKSEGTEPQNE